jgi:hypothetical protein
MYREIVFRLTAENHPDLNAKLSGFASQVKKAYEDAGKASMNAPGTRSGQSAPVDNYISGLLKAAKDRVELERTTNQKLQTEHATASELQAEYDAIKADQELNRLRALAKEKEAIERELSDKIDAIRAEGSGPVATVLADAKIAYEREQVAGKMLDMDRRIDDEKTRLATKGLQERIKIVKAEEREHEKATNAREAEIERTKSGLESAEGKYQSLQDQIRGANRETVANLAELGSSVMQAARGFTVLGLAGEEEMEKIVKGLLKIQGAFDIVSGGIQIWVKMQSIIEATRKSVLATAAAETALAEATKLRAAAQALGGVAGGAAGAAGSSAVGSAVGGAAVGAGGMGAAGLLGRFAKASLGKVGGLAGAGAGLFAVGSGVGMGLDYFSGDGYSRGGFGEKIGTGFVGPMALGRGDQFLNRTTGFGDSPFRGLADSEDAFIKADKARQRMLEIQQNQRNQVNQAIPGLQQGFAANRVGAQQTLSADLAEIERRGGQFGRQSSADVQKRLSEEILTTERQIAQVRETSSQTAAHQEELIKAYNEEQLALERSKRDLVVERATVARNAAEEEFRASERALKNVEDLLETQQRSLMTMQERVKSSEQRFGLMDVDQQQSALIAFRKGKSGGTLTTEELRVLQQIGSESADAIVAAQAESRAAKAGAAELFTKEREAIDKLTNDIARNVDVAAEISWEVSLDKKVFEDQAAALDKVIRDSVAEQTGKVSEVVVNGLKGIVGGVETRMNSRMDNLEQRLKDGAGARN